MHHGPLSYLTQKLPAVADRPLIRHRRFFSLVLSRPNLPFFVIMFPSVLRYYYPWVLQCFLGNPFCSVFLRTAHFSSKGSNH